MPRILSFERAAVELERAGRALQEFYSIPGRASNPDRMADKAAEAGDALTKAASQLRNAAAELESLEE